MKIFLTCIFAVTFLLSSCGINTKDKYMSSKLSQFVSEEYMNYCDKQMEDEVNVINNKLNKLQSDIAQLNKCCNSNDADSIAVLKNRIVALEKVIEVYKSSQIVKHVEVYYAFNSAKLNEANEKDIMTWISGIRSAGYLSDTTQIKIASYTDNVGDESYNNKLSERRSKAVSDFINTQLGISAERVIIEKKMMPTKINSPSLQRRSDIWIE